MTYSNLYNKPTDVTNLTNMLEPRLVSESNQSPSKDLYD